MTFNGILGLSASFGLLAVVESTSMDAWTRLGLGGTAIGVLGYTLRHVITTHTEASKDVAKSNKAGQIEAAEIHKQGLDNLSVVVDKMQNKLLDAALSDKE